VTDYKRFQSFIQSKGLWDEFKEKTLRNYKGCGMTMYKYFNMVAYEKEALADQSDLIHNAFTYVQNPYALGHPDVVWAQLHQDWIAELVSLNYKFRKITDE
jgi:hypothetical protein